MRLTVLGCAVTAAALVAFALGAPMMLPPTLALAGFVLVAVDRRRILRSLELEDRRRERAWRIAGRGSDIEHRSKDRR